MKFDRINVNRLDDIGYVIDKEKFLSGKYVIEARTEGNKNALNYCNIGDKISMSYPDINLRVFRMAITRHILKICKQSVL